MRGPARLTVADRVRGVLIERLAEQGVVTPGNRRFVERYELPRIRRIHAVIRSHAPEHKSLRVLNIGLLDGLVPSALLLLDANMTITSTERPDADLVQATGPASLQATGRHDTARLDLTAGDQTLTGFDWVVCGEVLPSPSLPQAMRNLRNAAERVVVTTPNLHALRYRVRHLLGVDFKHDPVSHSRMGLGHVSLLSARLLIDLAADAGLVATDLEFTRGPATLRAASNARWLCSQGPSARLPTIWWPHFGVMKGRPQRAVRSVVHPAPGRYRSFAASRET